MAGSGRVHDLTVRDLQAERASGLARAGERLEAALSELAEAEAALEAAPGPASRARRAEALVHAGERLWVLVVQREAVGLYRHDPVYEVLRVPPAVRAAMGPRPRGGPSGRPAS